MPLDFFSSLTPTSSRSLWPCSFLTFPAHLLTCSHFPHHPCRYFTNCFPLTLCQIVQVAMLLSCIVFLLLSFCYLNTNLYMPACLSVPAYKPYFINKSLKSSCLPQPSALGSYSLLPLSHPCDTQFFNNINPDFIVTFHPNDFLMFKKTKTVCLRVSHSSSSVKFGYLMLTLMASPFHEMEIFLISCASF